MRVPRAATVVLVLAAPASGCGGGGPSAATTATAPAAPPGAVAPAAGANHDWPLFGRTPDRSSASPSSEGLGAATVGRLRRIRLSVPGTVDSTPIYLHA